MIAAIKPVLAASLLALTAATAQAEMVTLTEHGGTISVHGDLIDYDGETYTLRTSLGDLSLKASRSICAGPGCPTLAAEVNNLFVAGSGTVTGRLIPQLAQAYYGDISADVVRDDDINGRTYFEIERENTSNIMMTMFHSNSASGVAKLISGELDAAFTTRPANAQEQLSAAASRIGSLRTETHESIIAYDSLLVVTHPSNPIKAMSETDIAKIFAGEITDWNTFERTPGPINVYMREADSNAHDLLTQVLLKPHRKDFGANVIVMKSDMEIAQAVADDPNAFGLTSFAYRTGVHALEIEGVCGIRVPPNQFSIKTGEYPLARPVYFYHDAEKDSADLNAFADFISSHDAQATIRDAGFVDREIISEPLNTQGLRVTHAIMQDETEAGLANTRNMLKLIAYSERLSTTIRFNNGSTDLDIVNYADLELLADLVRSTPYDGSTFYFIGFSDSVGRADLNQFVALQRAEIVRQALVSRYPELADRLKAHSVGYGELSPLACNETRPGRTVNRRVEVWVEKPMAIASR